MSKFLARSSMVLLLAAAPSFASPILVDGSWHEFLFGMAGSYATGCGSGCGATIDPVAERTSTAPWTFSGPANVTLTDLFQRGDVFQLFDNNTLIGTTSTPVNDGAGVCGGDILACLADPSYSHGSFLVGAGNHSLTIKITQNALGTDGGAGAFQLSAVPEPTLGGAFIGLALAGLAALRRRFR